MEINGKSLCIYCFEEKPENYGRCNVCGHEEGGRLSDAVLVPGTLLMGKYVVGRVLGKGGFGVTYLAFDLRRELKVAIKEYMPDTLAYRIPGNTIISTYEGDKEESFRLGAEKFYEEAKTVSRFNGHPNIINVQEFFYENNTAYFVMEYIEGVDLKTFVAQKGGILSDRECAEILIPVLDALIVVHSVGVLHRDISPDNIYITKDRGVKLLDFGAARQVLGEKSKSLSVVLKPGFAPIEQYQTRGKQGQWTDVYALAATMYYCLTGKVPEAAMDRVEAEMEDRKTDDIYLTLQNNSAISDDMSAVLRKALALRAGERYPNMAEFKLALLAAQDQVQPSSLSGTLQTETPSIDTFKKKISSNEYSQEKQSVIRYEPNHGEEKNIPLFLICGTVILLGILITLFSRHWNLERGMGNLLTEMVISLLASIAVAESYYCIVFNRADNPEALPQKGNIMYAHILAFIVPVFIHAIAGYGYTVGQTYAYTIIAIIIIAVAQILLFRHIVISKRKINKPLIISGIILMSLVPVIIWLSASRSVLLQNISRNDLIIWTDSLLKGIVEVLGCMTAMEIWIYIRYGKVSGKKRIIILLAGTIFALIYSSAARCFALVYFTYRNPFETVRRFFWWVSNGATTPIITIMLMMLAAITTAAVAVVIVEIHRSNRRAKKSLESV